MVSIKRTSLVDVLGMEELIPQAIIGQPVDMIIKSHGFEVEEGEDDLDAYVGAGLLLCEGPDQVQFALMHYAGHPKDSSTIYLPRHFTDVTEITNTIQKIATGLGISNKDIVWERRLDPDL